VVSIPLVIAGSQLIISLVQRYPALVVAGGGLLGFVAGEMFVEDTAVAPWLAGQAHVLHYAIPAACVAFVIVAARTLQRREAASKDAD
jgi:predicted tellurium resistance membrane protein TerC